MVKKGDVEMERDMEMGFKQGSFEEQGAERPPFDCIPENRLRLEKPPLPISLSPYLLQSPYLPSFTCITEQERRLKALKIRARFSLSHWPRTGRWLLPGLPRHGRELRQAREGATVADRLVEGPVLFFLVFPIPHGLSEHTRRAFHGFGNCRS